LAESQFQDVLRGNTLTLDPDIPISEVKPMRTVVSASLMTPPCATIFSVPLALILGLIGVCGVFAFFVSTHTRKMGIRLAGGTLPGDVLWLILKEEARFCLIGVPLGLASALVFTGFLSRELDGVSPAEPVTFVSAASVRTVATVLACYVATNAPRHWG
jgi:hypothetical protein